MEPVDVRLQRRRGCLPGKFPRIVAGLKSVTGIAIYKWSDEVTQGDGDAAVPVEIDFCLNSRMLGQS